MKILQGIAGVAAGVAEKFFERKTDADRFVAEFQTAVLQYANNDATRAQLILGEIQGESWLQRNWRPVLMLSVVGIVVNNYLLAPYVMLILGLDVVVALPDKLWNLMMIGVGGYIPGRSLEKAVKVWKENEK